MEQPEIDPGTREFELEDLDFSLKIKCYDI
jgi:hypothetical protein